MIPSNIYVALAKMGINAKKMGRNDQMQHPSHRKDAMNRVRSIHGRFVIILLGLGCLLVPLYFGLGLRSNVSTHAADSLATGDLSVVGPPTLPAATVNAIFARLGSPMAGTGALVEQTSRQTNIDDAFALGVWWTETNDGAAGVGLADRNPGSVRGSTGYPSAYDGYTIYPSYADAIAYWFHMLRNVYVIDRGLSTVYAISHPYVGTSSSPLWAGKVIALMLRYRGEAPPPTPTVAPSPTIAPNMLPHHRRIIDPAVTRKPVSLAANQPQHPVTHLVMQAAQTQSSLAARPSLATIMVVLFALLLALGIALRVKSSEGLWFSHPTPMRKGSAGFRFSHPTPMRKGNEGDRKGLHPAPLPSRPYNDYEEYESGQRVHLPVRSLYEPRTDELVAPVPVSLPVSGQLSRFGDTATTTGRLHRTQLLPTPPNAETPTESEPVEVSLPVGGRPTGLLARYGNAPGHSGTDLSSH